MVCWELPSVYLHLGTMVVKINQDYELQVNKENNDKTNETLKLYQCTMFVKETIKKNEPKDDGLKMAPTPHST